MVVSLFFATTQYPNCHRYPIAFRVLDGENDASWAWFFGMLKVVVPNSSELIFISDRNVTLIKAVRQVYPNAHHGYCICHLSRNVKTHVSNVNKDVVAWKFMECCKIYTEAEFVHAYAEFRRRYPSAAKYLDETTEVNKWAMCYFTGERYNIYTSNCAESLNIALRNARKYSLLPMIHAIVEIISKWFNECRKNAVSCSEEHKLVPFVENIVHNTCKTAALLTVTELDSFELEYNVNGCDGKPYLVNSIRKSCSCKCFDIDKYPCEHAITAVMEFMKHEDRGQDIRFHDLCSRYYWVEVWELAYYKTIYLVPDKSMWNVPNYISELQVIPPDYMKRKGRKQQKGLLQQGNIVKRPTINACLEEDWNSGYLAIGVLSDCVIFCRTSDV